MKKNSFYFLALLFLAALIFNGCGKDSCVEERQYIRYNPIFVSEEGLHPDISVEAPKDLENPGKIYFYQNYILINEKREGVHVIDNSIPASPTPIAFIDIPGNIDIAVKSGILYADCYLDLLAIDITDPTQATLVSREEQVFTPFGSDEENYLVYYEEEEVVEITECGQAGDDLISWGFQEDFVLANESGGSGSSGGVGGSFARFTIVEDYLYTVDYSDLRSFNIATPSTPDLVNTVNVGWNIETIYPFKENLFIGSQNGMFIYSITNPSTPVESGQFSHANACDPVVVDENYAYVTLRSGDECQGFSNQLDVLDITDVHAPSLIKSYPMQNPHGLTLNGDFLAICEGEYGLKTFNAADPTKIDQNLQQHIKDIATYDAISLNNGLLMVIGADGFFQYDYSNPAELKEISQIRVSN